jgi:hypothetical protein
MFGFANKFAPTRRAGRRPVVVGRKGERHPRFDERTPRFEKPVSKPVEDWHHAELFGLCVSRAIRQKMATFLTGVVPQSAIDRAGFFLLRYPFSVTCP